MQPGIIEVFFQKARHLPGCRGFINDPRFQRASGHPGILSRLRTLNKYQSFGLLDLLDSPGAVGTGSRKNYACGQILSVLRQGLKGGIDGKTRSQPPVGVLNRPVIKSDVVSGRDNVNMVLFDYLTVLNHVNGNFGMPGNYFIQPGGRVGL